MRESRDSEGQTSHVVFTIKEPNESKDKKCSYSTFDNNKKVVYDTPSTAPSLSHFDNFIVNDYT